MQVYHVVTDRPMKCGQHIIFDENHHSGVYERVQEKMEKVHDIYENPDKYDEKTLEHHTSVALRELALEEVRRKKYPQFPSRMSCLYVSRTLKEAEQWGEFFARIGRPTYSIVKLDVKGSCFAVVRQNTFLHPLQSNSLSHPALQCWWMGILWLLKL